MNFEKIESLAHSMDELNFISFYVSTKDGKGDHISCRTTGNTEKNIDLFSLCAELNAAIEPVKRKYLKMLEEKIKEEVNNS